MAAVQTYDISETVFQGEPQCFQALTTTGDVVLAVSGMLRVLKTLAGLRDGDSPQGAPEPARGAQHLESERVSEQR